jgi:hypothetical protein
LVLCPSCMTDVPLHNFCDACGAPLPQSQFSGAAAATYFRGRFKDPPALCCESIGGKFETTYWLMNDNALAVIALDKLGEASLRDQIRHTLDRFTVFGHDAFRNNGWTDPFIHEHVLYLDPLKTAGCYRWDESAKTFGTRLDCNAGMIGIMQEEWDGSTYGDEEYYPNLAASKALSWHKQYQNSGKTSDRWIRDFFITRMNLMWDPENLGFGKPDLNRCMTTYYLAAYLLVGEKCGWPEPFDPALHVRVFGLLNSLQLDNGGFATWYKVESGEIVDRNSGGNVETTSLAVYANLEAQQYFHF